jgi:hypothetical protein
VSYNIKSVHTIYDICKIFYLSTTLYNKLLRELNVFGLFSCPTHLSESYGRYIAFFV